MDMANIASAVKAKTITLKIKWGRQEYDIDLCEDDTVSELKRAIAAKTHVLPVRQKLLGLKCAAGKPPSDDVELGKLKLKPGVRIMMVGSCEEILDEVLNPAENLGDDVVNDLETEEEEILIENREEYLRKIERRVAEYKIVAVNQFRENKKLIVLDIDYTLFDHRSVADYPLQLMRPYLHEFLASVYVDYDIVIWSATNMKWVELKMKELGVLDNPNYKIAFMLDSLAMISIQSDKRGLIDVKPLGVIWGKHPQYHKENTIMLDDVGSNFLMNPQNGLKIRPFRNAHINRQKDKELIKLAQYLKHIAGLEGFSHLNHRRWEKYLKECNKK